MCDTGIRRVRHWEFLYGRAWSAEQGLGVWELQGLCVRKFEAYVTVRWRYVEGMVG